MFWTILAAIITSIIAMWIGYIRKIYLDQITSRNLSITLLATALLLLLLQILHQNGFFPEALAGGFMAAVYALFFGFFAGTAFQQYRQKTQSGEILYVNRSFLSDILTNIAAIILILFGIYRTSLLTPEIPFTPIRVTSGLSLISVGLYVFTLRPVPEFRRKGIILLDRIISWDDFIAYSWFSEKVIEIEYEREESIRTFKTMVPDDDQVMLEKLLSDKMKEKLEQKESV